MEYRKRGIRHWDEEAQCEITEHAQELHATYQYEGTMGFFYSTFVNLITVLCCRRGTCHPNAVPPAKKN